MQRGGQSRDPVPEDLHADAEQDECGQSRHDHRADVAELSQDADLSAGTVLAALFELEEAGLAGSDETGRYILLRP